MPRGDTLKRSHVYLREAVHIEAPLMCFMTLSAVIRFVLWGAKCRQDSCERLGLVERSLAPTRDRAPPEVSNSLLYFLMASPPRPRSLPAANGAD
jgi:hypothetical protein